jgi:hypothetical protein
LDDHGITFLEHNPQQAALVRNDVQDDSMTRGKIQSERIVMLRQRHNAFDALCVFLRDFKGHPMLRIAIICTLVLGLNPEIGGTALAADKTPSPPCKPLGKLWADFDAKTHFTALTPGQFHFVEGLYVGSPTTPEGLPPGDGALLATHDDAKNGIIIWTRGPLACAPIPINEKLVKLIVNVKTGALDGRGGEL